MSSFGRTLTRLTGLVAIVTVYVALHLAISAGLALRDEHRFRGATEQAAAVTAAVDRYAGGDASARAEVRAVEAWFKKNAPAGASRATASAVAAGVERGQVPRARERVAGLAPDVRRDQVALDRRVDASRTTALYWAVPAALLIGPALWLRRRRRAGAAEVVGVVNRFAARQPRWRRPVFLLATTVGYLLLAAGALAVGTAQRRGGEMPPTDYLLLLFGGLASVGAGVLLLRYTRPRSARGAREALLADGRRPVLYLRSFADDATAARVDDSAFFARLHSREEQFTAALGAIGPVIAVGVPGESLPRLGAARFYLPRDDWQPTIQRLMELSQLIVLRLGVGDGLWWEAEEARRSQPGPKLVLLASGDLPEMAQRLHVSLPPLPEAMAVDPWTGTVVTFTEGWQVKVTPVGPRPRPKAPRRALVRRGVDAVRTFWTASIMHTPAHHLARATRDALAEEGPRRRTMPWRATFAAQTALWTGFTLVTVLLLLGWLAGRAAQLTGI
ncbi:transferase [Streptomyces sp. NPDC050145]|uniref:transferase n=1 Tax=Streptomyces sp. NPDC050145 TaxID=3365602 RepID=UPI0037ADC249